MRSTKYLALFCLLMVSCVMEDQKSLDNSEFENLQLQQKKITNTNFENKFDTGKDDQRMLGETEIEYLESRMKWAAFLAAYSVLQDSGARDQITSAIANGSNYIRLSELLGTHLTDERFKNAFEATFDTYNCRDGMCPDPDTCCSWPDPPLGGGNNAKPAYDEFIYHILGVNCLELFFPSGLDFSPLPGSDIAMNITATAHPLNANSFNTGFILFEENTIYTTNAVSMINDTYVEGQNVMVVRPFRDPTNSNCFYEEIEVSDFTEFLCGQNCSS